MSIPLVDKYRAGSFSEIKGQDFAVERLKYFFDNFPDYKKAMILFGPAGTGKTSLAYALAKEYEAEIIEINSSDLRNRDQIDRIIKPASEQMSLFNQTKIILVDEVDGIAGVDRGGLQALLEIIRNTSFPIIMTANDIWHKKFAELRKNSEIVPVKQLNYKTIFYYLREVVAKEELKVDGENLLRIAIKCNGDVRAALNDLDVLKEEDEESEEVLSKELIQRDEKKDIFTIMKEVFKNKFTKETLRIYDKTDMTLDEIFLWIEENIPNEYRGEELYKAFNALSLADVFRGRIYRRQYWRFLVYQNLFLSAGISSAKLRPKFGFTSYKKPTRILKTWIFNQKNAKRKSIVLKYRDKNHISYKKALKEFPYLIGLLKNPQVHEELKLNSKEIDYIKELRN